MRDIGKPRSLRSRTVPAAQARSKLGQPVPDSNLASVSKSAAPQPAQWNTPAPSTWRRSPDHGGSVPARRRTAYRAGESCAFHSSSVLPASNEVVSSARRLRANTRAYAARAAAALPMR